MATDPTFLSRLAQAGSSLFDAEARQQCAAMCHRPGENDALEVLLVTTRRTGRWTMPKGWPMKGRQLHEAAAQEALEEAGVQGKADKHSIGRYTYPKLLADGRVIPCMVEVFPLKVDKVLKHFKEEGQRTTAWVSCSTAASMVDEPELRGLLMLLERRLRTS
jgi:8-oxo-dGTP pyrophosphatase MutT (NUDIX family)